MNPWKDGVIYELLGMLCCASFCDWNWNKAFALYFAIRLISKSQRGIFSWTYDDTNKRLRSLEQRNKDKEAGE